MLDVYKPNFRYTTRIPAVYADEYYDRETIQLCKFLGYMDGDHVVLQKPDQSIIVVYNIDLDWSLYNPEIDMLRD